jgi:hypothetical protein
MRNVTEMVTTMVENDIFRVYFFMGLQFSVNVTNCRYFMNQREKSCPIYMANDKNKGLCTICLQSNVKKWCDTGSGYLSHLRQIHKDHDFDDTIVL